jgi:hypothetical protein
MNTDSTRLGAPHLGELTEVSQHLAALQAHCALDGIDLHAIKDNRGRTIYVVSKGPMERELGEMGVVAQWLGLNGLDAAAAGEGV